MSLATVADEETDSREEFIVAIENVDGLPEGGDKLGVDGRLSEP